MHPQKGSVVRWGGSCLYGVNVSEVCTPEVLWECMIHHTSVSFFFFYFILCKIVCLTPVESLFFNGCDTCFSVLLELKCLGCANFYLVSLWCIFAYNILM